MMPRERLTEKEIQVAGLVWQGLTNREIGRQIGTTEQVIKNHLRSTFDKLGVWTRLELAMYVASHGGKDWLSDGNTRCLIRHSRKLGATLEAIDRRAQTRRHAGDPACQAAKGLPQANMDVVCRKTKSLKYKDIAFLSLGL
jgi:DNA-binding CsgD family transcriptional regulator